MTRVRTGLAEDGTHRHLLGVCTAEGSDHAVRTVVDSLNAGDVWTARAKGAEATIRVVPFCPQRGCLASPYLATAPDSRCVLEQLPGC